MHDDAAAHALQATPEGHKLAPGSQPIDFVLVSDQVAAVLEAMTGASNSSNPCGVPAAALVMGFAAQVSERLLGDPDLARRVLAADDPTVLIATLTLDEGELVGTEFTRALGELKPREGD